MSSSKASPPSISSKGALAEVWTIAWPTVATMTSYTVMQFVDAIMVGQVGTLEVAAQGNGGIWVFTALAIALGFLTVVNTFVSQNLGAGRPEQGPPYAWAALWLSAGFWAFVLLPAAVALPWLFGYLYDAGDPALTELVRLQTGYGRILLIGAVFTLAGRSMHHYFFGLHRPRIITVSAFLGNGVNIVANYVFIFGAEGLPAFGLPGVPGMPALGLNGAALGTVLGSAVELAVPMAVFLGARMNAELQSRAAWRPAWGPVRDLLRIGWPAAIQYGNEIICWALFMSVLVGRFGPDHMTAGWIALRYMHLSFMPAVGFSVAVTSLVGRYIGAGQPDVAVSRARFGLLLAVAYMTTCALVFFIFRDRLVGAFVGGEDTTPEQAARIVDIGAKLLVCAAVFQTFDAVGIVYTGALRGAGDTVWPGVMTMFYSWILIIGGGWLMIELAPGLESIGPWIAAASYIGLLGLTMALRFESGRWRSINLLGTIREEAAAIAPLGPAPPAANPDGAVQDIAEELGAELSEPGLPSS